MEESKVKDEVVDQQEEVVDEVEEDELDSWFDADEDDGAIDNEDLSAEEEEEDEPESSPEESDDEPEPDDEDPSEDADTKSASEEGTSDEPEKEEEDPYKWINELDPAFREEAERLRKETERLVQSDRSNRGRVAALQRQLDSVRAKQEAHERMQPSAAAKQAVTDGKPLEDMDDEELAAFLEEFPSVGKNVQKLIDKRIREELERNVRPIQEERLSQQLEANRQALRQEANIIFNTAETGIDLDDVLSSQAFHTWVQRQPPEYQDFARRAESVDAAAKVLEDFAIYTERQVAAEAEQQEKAALQDSAPSNTTQSADQTAARRRKARQGTGPKSKSAQLKNTDSLDSYEAYFNDFVENG